MLRGAVYWCTKILICLSFVSLVNAFFYSYSNGQTYLALEDTPQQTVIVTPHENIKTIPIIDYKLIYQVTTASLVDFLENQIESFKQKLASVGIQPRNIVIIYLDYMGKPSIPDEYSYKYHNEEATPDLSSYITDEQVSVNLNSLVKHYSLDFFITKRRVILGTLISQNSIFQGNNDIKVYEFSFPQAKGRLLIKFDDIIKSPNDTSKSTINGSKGKNSVVYTREEIIHNRANMLSYMNSGNFSPDKFLGMMEYYDIAQNFYAYFALDGNLNDYKFNLTP